MQRRIFLTTAATGLAAASVGQAAKTKQLIINGAEHAWVVGSKRFPIDPKKSNCPNSKPTRNYSMEHILAEMQVHSIAKTVISHVCYYGTDNSYPAYCIKKHPDRFAAIGLLVGFGLHKPNDPRNPSRLEELMVKHRFSGLRLSPIYDSDVRWLNDPVCYPLWKKAEKLKAVFNIFLKPHQLGQVGDMARRFPGVNIVIDHFAMIDISKPASAGIDKIVALAKLPNVYVRTSLHNPSQQSMPYRDMWPYLKRAYDAFGPKRLIYGNFYELLIMKDLVPFFTVQDKEWILGKAADRIYFASRPA